MVNTSANTWSSPAKDDLLPRRYRIELNATEFDIQFVVSSALMYRGAVTVLEEEPAREPLTIQGSDGPQTVPQPRRIVLEVDLTQARNDQHTSLLGAVRGLGGTATEVSSG